MPTPAYDPIAEWYDALVRSSMLAGDVVLPHVFTLLGDVQNQPICDLACGQGRLARALAQDGAQVVGVDISARLIAIAQRDEADQPLGITYIVDDAATLASLGDAQFQGVVCNLALMDIADLGAVCRTVWRILRPLGWFVFSITHPCFEAPHAAWRTAPDGTISREIFTYFAEGLWYSSNVQGVRGQVGANHRMLSTYLNTLSQTGFLIDRIIEPQPLSATVAVPGYRVIPAFMLVRCTKLGSPG
jgi:ubiquinone/menaquinone biosynthesis C-methylase UbiE